jgi:hypothetical protein
MPTVLGLLGWREPYFAFGRDVLREPHRTPFAVSYSSGYIAVTDSISLFFDENRVTAAYDVADTLLRHDILPARRDETFSTERLLKAFIQQYYEHIEKQDYRLPNEVN